MMGYGIEIEFIRSIYLITVWKVGELPKIFQDTRYGYSV